MTYAIDFDDTIMDTNNVTPGYRMGMPMAGAVESLRKFRVEGARIIVFTVRAITPEGRKAVEDWMLYFHIPFNQVTALKPQADYYIDNRAIHFDNWSNVLNKIEKDY